MKNLDKHLDSLAKTIRNAYFSIYPLGIPLASWRNCKTQSEWRRITKAILKKYEIKPKAIKPR